jgi:hypothetical protein
VGVHHEPPDAAPTLTYLQLVARQLQREPALLAVARDNVRRWLADGVQARERLLAWDDLLARAQAGPQGMARLQQLLAADDPESQRLCEFAPFAGLLTREQRREARDLCSFRH